MASEPQRKGIVISLGWARDDDPIYTGGWDLVIGSHLAHIPTPPREDEVQPEPSAPSS